jgi:hypothetical protein
MPPPTSRDLDILDVESNAGYLGRPLPSARDDEITALLDRARQDGRATQLVDLLRPRQDAVLRAFAERMAALAVRAGDRAVLRNGLLSAAVAFVVPDVDVREVLLILPLLWHSAGRLELDPAAEFRATAEEFPPAARDLWQFVARAPADQRIEAMGYVESADADGFRYERTW